MNDLENDIYNPNKNIINNYNTNQKIIPLNKNKYKSKTTKNRNRKSSNFIPKTQQNQIMNYNLINFNSNQNQIIPPLINNPMFLNDPYMLNSDMNNQFINNQTPYFPTITPLPPIQQFNYPYPYMNNFNNDNNNFYYNEPGIEMFNQDMPPPLIMPNGNNNNNNNINNNFNNKNNQNKIKSNVNKFKNKFRNNNINKINNNIINKKNIIKDKNKIVPINNNMNKNQKEKEQKEPEKENQNIKEEIQKDISKEISEIKPEESKTNINKSIETDKLEDKSISYQIGYLDKLKRNQQRQISNLEEKQNKLFKIKAKIKKYEIQNEIKLGKIYTTLGQKRSKKYRTASIHRGNINIKDNNNLISF